MTKKVIKGFIKMNCIIKVIKISKKIKKYQILHKSMRY